mgnify:CR=1 FL=1
MLSFFRHKKYFFIFFIFRLNTVLYKEISKKIEKSEVWEMA